MSGDGGNISADDIIKKLKDLEDQLGGQIKLNSEKIDQLLTKLELVKDEDKKTLEAELNDLKSKLETLTTEKGALTQQLSKLNDINAQVVALEKTVGTLSVNNQGLQKEINKLDKPRSKQGGFQYNKKHSKHKRPFRLFSRSNSKRTSKKSKKRRRRPGKSVKKGGMKTRRRRRNKKSKKSKKRRK